MSVLVNESAKNAPGARSFMAWKQSCNDAVSFRSLRATRTGNMVSSHVKTPTMIRYKSPLLSITHAQRTCALTHNQRRKAVRWATDATYSQVQPRTGKSCGSTTTAQDKNDRENRKSTSDGSNTRSVHDQNERECRQPQTSSTTIPLLPYCW